MRVRCPPILIETSTIVGVFFISLQLALDIGLFRCYYKHIVDREMQTMYDIFESNLKPGKWFVVQTKKDFSSVVDALNAVRQDGIAQAKITDRDGNGFIVGLTLPYAYQPTKQS